MTRNLRLLLAAQFVSLLGDGLYLAVIVNYALRALGGSQRQAGLVPVAESLPYLVLGIWAGVLVDRLDRRRVMMAADLLRAGVLAGLYAMDRRGLLADGGLPVLALLCASSATLTVGSIFFNPARDALLPGLVQGGDLLRANGAVAVSQHAAQLLGPLAAALLLASRPMAEIFLWDAGSFLVSWAFLAAIRVPRWPRPAGGPVPDVRGALAYVAGRPDLKSLLLLTALNNLLLMGPVVVCSVFLVNETAAAGGGLVLPGWLGGRLSREAMFAVYMAAFSAGMILGTLLLARLGRGVARWKLLALGILLDGLTFLPFEPLARGGRFPLLVLALLVHALVVPLINVLRPAILQTHVPAERQGQVFALVNLTVFGGTALSALLANGLLATGMLPSRMFTLVAIGGTLSGLLALGLKPLRRLV